MYVTRTVRFLLAALSVVGFMATASAAPAGPIQGQDYKLLSPAQPAEAGKKVEVIEFFAYYCPHCNALEHSLSDWVKSQGDKIVFKRVHVSNNGEPMAQQKLYYTLETMGKADEYQAKVFYAIHVQHHRFFDDNEIIDYAVKDLGINHDKFVSVYNSFSVQTKVARAIQAMQNYQIDSWPTIIVDGKYVTSPSIAGARMANFEETGSHALMLKVLDGLVDMQLKERAKH